MKKKSSLVDAGVITQDKADDLAEFMKEQVVAEKKISSRQHEEGFLNEAVNEGVITQDEADAIQEQWQKEREGARGNDG